MNEEDIKKQLEVKNKEIYLNKLNLDLNNNIEVLVLTIDNLLNNTKNDCVNKILGIAETFQKEMFLKEKINIFLEEYREYLMNLFDNQKKDIEKLICDNNEINNIKKYLYDNYEFISNKLNNYFDNNINNLVKNIQVLYTDSFCKKRIEEYLRKIFKSNLNNKILDSIKGRNIILINTFNETYLKYLELNKNTVGIE